MSQDSLLTRDATIWHKDYITLPFEKKLKLRLTTESESFYIFVCLNDLILMEKKINIFSFFAGAGFLDLGFESTGHYDIVYVNEFNKTFNDIYRHSRAHLHIEPPMFGYHVEDISTLLSGKNLTNLRKMVRAAKKQGLIGFIGGPPCPDFSVAGKNKGKDGDNGKLSEVYCEIICKIKPDFFLFENVKGLYQTQRHREYFEHLKERFLASGYYITEQLINALEYGVPQDRERIILLGFNKKMVKDLSLSIDHEKQVGFDWDNYKLYTRADIASISWPQIEPFEEDSPRMMPQEIIPDLTIQYWWEKNDVENHPNSRMFFRPKAGLPRFQSIPEGDDKKKCFKRLHRWRYSPTAAYGNNEVHLHPYKPRRISVAEALAIQSLPKEFEIPINTALSDAFKTIGNGVPYLAAKSIANNIYDYINKCNNYGI